MPFAFETPLIQRLRKATRRASLLIAAIADLVLAALLAAHPLLEPFDLGLTVAAVLVLLPGIGLLVTFCSAKRTDRPLPGVGYALAARLSLLSAFAAAAASLLFSDRVLLLLDRFSVLFGDFFPTEQGGLPFVAPAAALLFLLTAVAWYLLRDTARNNRPHGVFPVFPALILFLAAGVMIGFAVYGTDPSGMTVSLTDAAFLYPAALLLLAAASAVTTGIFFLQAISAMGESNT